MSVRITVRGRLGPHIAHAFEGITVAPGEGTTDLLGEVADQSQFHGLLARIRDLGLEIESVSVAGREEEAR